MGELRCPEKTPIGKDSNQRKGKAGRQPLKNSTLSNISIGKLSAFKLIHSIIFQYPDILSLMMCVVMVMDFSVYTFSLNQVRMIKNSF